MAVDLEKLREEARNVIRMAQAAHETIPGDDFLALCTAPFERALLVESARADAADADRDAVIAALEARCERLVRAGTAALDEMTHHSGSRGEELCAAWRAAVAGKED